MNEMTQAEKDAALLDAAIAGKKLRKYLLLGADINARDSFNNTPLILAAKNARVDACEVLIDGGADVNAKNDSGMTALFYPSGSPPGNFRLKEWQHAQACFIVSKLIAKGADVNATANDNYCVLDYAMAGADHNIQMLLLRHGVTATASQATKDLIKKLTEEIWQDFSKHYPLGTKPTLGNCFDAKRISNMVLDACVTGQFGALIGAPLLTSQKSGDRALFQKIWDQLPETWQTQNASLYVQFQKLAHKPVFGSHTATIANENTPSSKKRG